MYAEPMLHIVHRQTRQTQTLIDANAMHCIVLIKCHFRTTLLVAVNEIYIQCTAIHTSSPDAVPLLFLTTGSTKQWRF